MPHDFDPDDNFGQAFHADADIDEEAAADALVWQLLLLINPGDEDAALQQFATWQEALQHAGEDRERGERQRRAEEEGERPERHCRALEHVVIRVKVNGEGVIASVKRVR